MFLSRLCPGCRQPIARSARRSCPCLAPVAGPLRLPGLIGVDRLTALYRYEPPVAATVLAAKNGARPDLLRSLGRRLAELESLSSGPPFDAVTWIPASRAPVPAGRGRPVGGRWAGGGDHGRLLSREVGRALGVPSRRLLVRVGGDRQVGRTRTERLDGPGLWAPHPVPGRVLVVDDVITTGASMTEAAVRLRSVGARSIIGLAVAAVAPFPESLSPPAPATYSGAQGPG